MDRPTRYGLSVRLEIEKQEWNGPITPDKEFDESQGGYWTTMAHERLSVNEQLNLGSMDFLGVMQVLAELHTAISTIKPKVK